MDLKVTVRTYCNHIRDYYLVTVLSALSLLKSKNNTFKTFPFLLSIIIKETMRDIRDILLFELCLAFDKFLYDCGCCAIYSARIDQSSHGDR